MTCFSLPNLRPVVNASFLRPPAVRGQCFFSLYDSLAKRHGCFKVKNTGPSYLACSGCPVASDSHARAIADLALGLLQATRVACEELGTPELSLRVGIHSGPLVGGVIRAANNHRFDSKEAGGQSSSCRVHRHTFTPPSPPPTRPRLPNTTFSTVLGGTVNLASRMQSEGEAGRVQVSAAARDLLIAAGAHALSERGLVAVKGAGQQVTFWLDGRREGAGEWVADGGPGEWSDYGPAAAAQFSRWRRASRSLSRTPSLARSHSLARSAVAPI